MDNSVSSRTFRVSVRLKRLDQGTPALPQFGPELCLPRIRPCEIASAAGLDAVRRALDEMHGGGHPPA